MRDAQLSANQLTYGYRGIALNHPFDLKLAPGQIWAMLGCNGAGKSTLLKTLLGLLPPLSGDVLVGTQSLHQLTPAQRAAQLSYVPQSQTIGFGLSCIDMVLMASNARRTMFAAPSKEEQEHARHCLVVTGLADQADLPFDELSGGQRQLALIARALHQKAQFLLVDEPCSHLDFGNQQRVLEMLTKLAHEGHGILMTTHDPQHAQQTAQQVLLLKPSGEVTQGEPQAQLQPEQLSELYGLDAETIRRISRLRA